jgi:hypothetical protein
MSKLRFIQASRLGNLPDSIKFAEPYFQVFRSCNPVLDVDTLELLKEDIPSFNEDRVAVNLHDIHSDIPNNTQNADAELIGSIAVRFRVTDHYAIWFPHRMAGHRVRSNTLSGALIGLSCYLCFRQNKPARSFSAATARCRSQLIAQIPLTSPRHSAELTVSRHTCVSGCPKTGVLELDEVQFQPTL